MVFADWQAGRQIKKSDQARGHRQERQEGRLAEGQAARLNSEMRTPYFAATVPTVLGGRPPLLRPVFRINPLSRQLEFGETSRLTHLAPDSYPC